MSCNSRHVTVERVDWVSVAMVFLALALASASCASDDTESQQPTHDAAVEVEVDAAASTDTQAAPTVISPTDWMSDVLAAFPDTSIRLVDLALPRSHDTGTYILNACDVGATECNTQTQHLTMQGQLEAGVRFFDIRPVLNDDEYFTYHRIGCGDLGCDGDSMANVLSQTREFLDAHAELVVFEVGHLCRTSATDETLVALIADAFGERLYRETEPTQGTSPPGPFIQRPLRDILPAASATGKVVVLWSGLSDTVALRAEGRFAESFIPIKGSYSNAQEVDPLIVDQKEKYAAFTHDEAALFKLSWTLTMNAELTVGCLFSDAAPTLATMAGQAHAALPGVLNGLVESGGIAPGAIPNLISLDFVAPEMFEHVLALTLLNVRAIDR
jgi:hypothetical protein